MNLHENNIAARLVRFLERKSPPLRLRTQMAQDDEMRVLMAKISNVAPRYPEPLALWWPLFESELGDLCGDFWPSEKHIKPAAKEATVHMPKSVGKAFNGADMRPAAIISRKMNANEPVGEEWLWGRGAVELMAENLVSQEKIDLYRQGAFLNRIGSKHPSEDAYQAALNAARQWETEAKERHEAARQAWGQPNDKHQFRNIQFPDKRVVYSAENTAAE